MADLSKSGRRPWKTGKRKGEEMEDEIEGEECKDKKKGVGDREEREMMEND